MTSPIANLRRLCNREISAANRAAYREYPNGPIINPPVPFDRVNELLKACDAVFAEHDAQADIIRDLARHANINVNMSIPANGGVIHSLKTLAERAFAIVEQDAP